MDIKIKKKWLKALRSGKYKQGRCALRTQTDHFCCLGVLCDITNNSKWSQACGQWFYLQNYITSLPISLRHKYQLSESEEAKLMRMNDNGRSFKEIADYIEENL